MAVGDRYLQTGWRAGERQVLNAERPRVKTVAVVVAVPG
jgi:hypothetical protein